jgi:hypothetical protein
VAGARSGDTQISGNAADFVTLAESRLNRDLPLRVMQTTTTLTATAGSRSVALPSDFIEPYTARTSTSIGWPIWHIRFRFGIASPLRCPTPLRRIGF